VQLTESRTYPLDGLNVPDKPRWPPTLCWASDFVTLKRDFDETRRHGKQCSPLPLRSNTFQLFCSFPDTW